MWCHSELHDCSSGVIVFGGGPPPRPGATSRQQAAMWSARGGRARRATSAATYPIAPWRWQRGDKDDRIDRGVPWWLPPSASAGILVQPTDHTLRLREETNQRHRAPAALDHVESGLAASSSGSVVRRRRCRGSA